MKALVPAASLRRICSVLDVSRSSLYGEVSWPRRRRSVDEELAGRIAELIKQHPTYGYRRIWALLRFREDRKVNRKKVYRIMQMKRWMVTQRQVTPRPRVRACRSQAADSNERWAMDVTHVHCGTDGWAHLAAIIDCHDREIVGHEFALRGRAREAERALEAACIRRFGTLRPEGQTPIVRSDNGLIFQSRRFREACRLYRLCSDVADGLLVRRQTGYWTSKSLYN